MFTVSRHTSRYAVVVLLALAGLIALPAAQANALDEIKSCFSFLNAQNYARAEQTAQALLRRNDLDRSVQRYANLCLGKALVDTGRISDALPVFLRAEALSQSTKELAVAYNWLGPTYESLNDLDHAELYDQRAIKANRELGDRGGEATALNNLATVVEKRGDVDRALTLYQEALSIEPDEAKKPSTLNNIALIYSSRKDYLRATAMLRQAIEIDRRNGDGHGVAMHQINLGGLLIDAKQYVKAEKELLAGLNAIRLVGDKHGEAEGCSIMGNLAFSRKNKTLAREWYEKAEALYREIGDTNNADQIANLLSGK